MSPLLYPSQKGRTAKLFPRARGRIGTEVASQANGYRSVTKHHIDEAHARALFGISLGYRLSPCCRWNGEYFVADLSDLHNLGLAEDASAQGIVIR